jgi:hypothetical protein
MKNTKNDKTISRRKLTLGKETLRRLESNELTPVAGGAPFTWGCSWTCSVGCTETCI